jgi:hypothetical protein
LTTAWPPKAPALVTFLLPARGCPHGRFDLTSRTNMSPSKRAVDSR